MSSDPEALAKFKAALGQMPELQPYQRTYLSRLTGIDIEVHPDPTDPDTVLVFNRRALSRWFVPMLDVSPLFEPPRFVVRPDWEQAMTQFKATSLMLLGEGPTFEGPRLTPEQWENLHLNRYWSDFAD